MEARIRMTRQAAPEGPSPPVWGKVDPILDRHERQASRLTQILQAIQDEYQYLPQEALYRVIDVLGIPAARVFGVASFYPRLSMEPRGRHLIRLCDGTACHVKRSIPILEAIRARLGLDAAKVTSDDMLFTVETVACLGACVLAPAMLIDDEVHAQVTPDRAVQLIDTIIQREAAIWLP